MDGLEDFAQMSLDELKAARHHDDQPVDYLVALGSQLEKSYWKTSSLTDLDESIEVAREALNMTPSTDSERVERLSDLAGRLTTRYSRTDILTDLEEVVRMRREILDAIPRNDPRQDDYSYYHVNDLLNLYTRTTDIAVLDEAIDVTRNVTSLPRADANSTSLWLHLLGQRLGLKFLTTGDLATLEEAIEATQRGIDVIPKDHGMRPERLQDLGQLHGTRYSKLGSMSDLDKAINLIREAVEADKDQPEGFELPYPKGASWSVVLATQLCTRFERTAVFADLEEAISTVRQVMQMTEESHHNWPVCCNNLGIYLERRYREKNDMADLDEAIRCTKNAYNSVEPRNEHDRANWLDRRATLLGIRAEDTDNLEDCEEAIGLAREAVEAMPDEHPDKLVYWYNLGNRLRNQWIQALDLDALEESYQCYEVALYLENATIRSRLRAGLKVLHYYLSDGEWERAYDISDVTVSLIPKLAPNLLEFADKQHLLSEVVGHACDAAAASFHMEQDPVAVLSLLERGRGVVAASLQEIRVDALELQQSHPELAERFAKLQEEVSQQGESRRRGEVIREFDDVVAQIREHPGFEDFLTAPSEKNLRDAASEGPIIVINVSHYRCDAVLVESHQIRSIHLPDFKSKDVDEKGRGGSRDLESRQVLEWLWDTVAKPILTALGFTGPPAAKDQWPHVWWIPTGRLSKYPLHAAGYHHDDTAETVLDRVVSSYSSSVKAILDGRRRHPPTASDPQTRAVLVAMANTPGHAGLPFASAEIAMLEKQCKSMAMQPILPGQSTQEVLECLPGCKVFHFAGHGRTGADPSMSGLLLRDGLLTVATMMETNLYRHAPFLAYLSACGTGRIKDDKYVDESVHLVSAFQLAGFRHVIGTLWEVADESCIVASKVVYQKMQDGDMTDESVRRGLHMASRQLRDSWLSASSAVRGAGETDGSTGEVQPRAYARPPMREFVDWEDEIDDLGPANWVPYVHFGA